MKKDIRTRAFYTVGVERFFYIQNQKRNGMNQDNMVTGKLPKIGLRIIKSAIAVALCFLLDSLRKGEGIVFYSQLSALWCMQVYRQNTRQNAIQRTIGTSIGAGYGLLFLLLNRQVHGRLINHEFEKALSISLLIILVLYTTVLIKKKQASYFSCVVFLSIVVNHIGDANPYLFVWNRFLDTMLGIIIGIAVNNFAFPTQKDRKTLFISTMDETLLNEKSKMSDFSKVELNRMIEDGMKFTIATMRTPAIICENMRDIKLKYPVIAMDGAVMYDVNTKTYIKTYVISAAKAKELRDFIEGYNSFYFTNIIMDDTLLIYYQSEISGIMKKLVDDLRANAYRNYLQRPIPEKEDVVYFMLLDREEKQKRLYDALLSAGYGEDFKIDYYPSSDYPDCYYLKIFNRNATMGNMMNYLKEYTQIDQTITLGTVANKYDITISGRDANEAVNNIRSIYEKPFYRIAKNN